MQISYAGWPKSRSAILAPFCGLLAGFLLVAPIRAQQAVSSPIGGSIGDPVYQESTQTGPSSSLFLGDSNLQTPYIHTAISDPLSYLLESGGMSPYVAGTEVNASSADAFVRSVLLVDSTLTERLSEYRDNRALMGGAGTPTIPDAQTPGSSLSRASGAAAPGAAAGAFSSLTVRTPFAAGSLATRRAAAATGASGFIDPNALLAAANSSSALTSGQSGVMTSSTDVPGAAAGSTIFASDESGTAYDVFATAAGGDPGVIAVPPANGTVAGPAAGEVFPDVSMVMPSGTGFPDSTMGTAGPPFDTGGSGVSPLTSSRASSDISPFRALNSPTSRFLDPSLVGISGGEARGLGGGSGGTSFSEVIRKARLHAMIYNPGAEMPSPFAQRTMERDYRKQHSGRHVRHQPRLTAQSSAGQIH